MKISILALAFCVLMAGESAFAGQPKLLADFLGPQGCAIGPPTRNLASAAGYGNEAIDAVVAKAAADPHTIRTGDWIVLPSSLCRIRPLDRQSEIHLDDPDVKVITSHLDAYAESGIRGCFLFGPTLMDVVSKTRGWDEDRAYVEWVRFAVENLRAGNLAFYGTDPSKPPPGFLVLTGDCANIPDLDAIRRSQAIRDREFDFFIRANASDVVCGQGRAVSPRAKDVVRERAGNANTNQWMAIEVAVLALGGGWFPDASALRKGTLRPPLCHFE